MKPNEEFFEVGREYWVKKGKEGKLIKDFDIPFFGLKLFLDCKRHLLIGINQFKGDNYGITAKNKKRLMMIEQKVSRPLGLEFETDFKDRKNIIAGRVYLMEKWGLELLNRSKTKDLARVQDILALRELRK